MDISDYFGDWKKVISYKELRKIMGTLEHEYAHKEISPPKSLVFKAFHICPYSELKVVMIGLDPYPQKGIATGVLFGNYVEDDAKISPSLRVIKESAVDFSKPHNQITFDHSLETWARQGCLMINSALTVETGYTGSHTMLWRSFMTSFLQRLSEINTGIIYVLFGSIAHTFIPYLGKHNYILKYKHPAHAARTGQNYECDAFVKINQILLNNHNTTISWYYEN
jgi:uracil-DNA glycosylase